MIDFSTELARERSREAVDRLLMARIRPALALIGFGVGELYGYFHAAGLQERLDPHPQHAELRGQLLPVRLRAMRTPKNMKGG